MSAAPFRSLALQSWHTSRAVLRPLFVGLLLFGIPAAVFQMFLPEKGVEGAPIADMPTVLILSLLYILFSWAGYFYCLVVGVEEEQSFQRALKRTPRIIWPCIVISFWVFTKLYGWLLLPIFLLAVIGGVMVPDLPIFATTFGLLAVIIAVVMVVLAPRYGLSFFLWLKGRGTPKAVVLESYTATRGYWGKVVGNPMLCALLFIPFVLILVLLVKIARSVVEPLGGPLLFSIFQLIIIVTFAWFAQSFTMVFWSKLTDTILKNPRS